MSRYYNKDELKNQLELENIYDIVSDLGGEPEYTDFGLVSSTICHNLPGEGSRKLYYYNNTKLFSCYTSCGTFDIFELVVKVKKIQKQLEWELHDAMCYVADYFGFEGASPEEEKEELADWQIFKRYELAPVPTEKPKIMLKEYDDSILSRFVYPKIAPWLKEGITQEVLRKNLIGYYPGDEQITIPHFDMNGRLVGIRGRALSKEEADIRGKYRPLYANNTLYTHSLSMNLYNLNNSRNNISKTKTAIIFEGEKSALKYQSYYGEENDISVACCGSSITSYQINLLLNLGVKEVIIAFDRQFQEIGDKEHQRLKKKLISLYKKYNHDVQISAIFDKDMITCYKAAPIDETKEKFEYLLNNRIRGSDFLGKNH